MKTSLFAAALCASPAVTMASRLYATSYAGIVSTLSLTPTNNGNANTTGHLSVTSQSKACGPSPSWLALDKPHDILYCLDEGIDHPNGSIASFHTNGSLTPIKHLETISGPVMSAFYSADGVPDRKFMAVAHYGGSTVTTYTLNHGHITPFQIFPFRMNNPGPNPDRQDAPHPHGVYLDPTGRYILVPDLGADLLRIFAIDPSTGKLEPVSPFHTEPGLGPRHLAFWTPKEHHDGCAGEDEVYLYLVSELMNTVTGFKVHYSLNGLEFKQVFKESTFGGGKAGSESSKAAEIAVSPQKTHLIITNRLDSTFGPQNDSIAVFTCANAQGTSFAKPSFQGLQPSYGSNPRQFEIGGANDGHLVAVALQNSHGVVVKGWDEQGDAPKGLVARIELKGEVPSVIWG